jgi:hypothetical protein
MTTYSTISNASVAVGAIPSSSLVTALRDNPTAIAEAASGAPVVFAGWHPYDKVSVGDSKDGLIYDHAVTGIVSNVVTPDFEDGYEYRVIAHGLTHAHGSNTYLTLEAYKETDADYDFVTSGATPAGASTAQFGMEAEFLLPRLATVCHLISMLTYSGDTVVYASSAMSNTPAQKILRARLSFADSTYTIRSGKVWLLRRREYVTSP